MITEFLDVDCEFQCAICLGAYVDPQVITSCGHSFCDDCLKRLAQSRNTDDTLACPTCKKKYNHSSLMPNYQLREATERMAVIMKEHNDERHFSEAHREQLLNERKRNLELIECLMRLCSGMEQRLEEMQDQWDRSCQKDAWLIKSLLE